MPIRTCCVVSPRKATRHWGPDTGCRAPGRQGRHGLSRRSRRPPVCDSMSLHRRTPQPRAACSVECTVNRGVDVGDGGRYEARELVGSALALEVTALRLSALPVGDHGADAASADPRSARTCDWPWFRKWQPRQCLGCKPRRVCGCPQIQSPHVELRVCHLELAAGYGNNGSKQRRVTAH